MQQYNLKKIKGTHKGSISEHLFASVMRGVVLASFRTNKTFYLLKNKGVSEEKINFIRKHIYSIDAFKIEEDNITLFEIKTREFGNKRKTEVTKSLEEIFLEAKKLGFKTKLAIVYLHNDWNFSVEIKEFSRKYYYPRVQVKYHREHNFAATLKK